MKPILTLTTDFGDDGPYVAALKGVVLQLAPEAQIVDVSHKITAQNVLEGAFVMAAIVDAFPPGTVHLGVVDPGVGTSRKLAAVKVAGQWIVGPDNGLLCGVVRGREPEGIWEIANPSLWRPVISNTFHGRDILAPAAAHLLARGAPEVLGPRMNKVIHLANFDPRETEQGLVGEVIFRDAFGNLITNVRGDRLGSRPENQDWEIEIAGSHVQGLVRTYAHRMHGELVALVGSSGWVEIAIVNGDASRFLSAGPGTTVWFHRRGHGV
jgi:S-adenosylmethionine hydrolase